MKEHTLKKRRFTALCPSLCITVKKKVTTNICVSAPTLGNKALLVQLKLLCPLPSSLLPPLFCRIWAEITSS